MLQDLREVAVKAILGAADPQALEALRIQYLGKKGDLTKLLKMMGKLDPSERPAMGQLANQVRAEVENALAQRKDELSALLLERKLASEAVDVTIPGKPTQIGHEHPMYVVLDEIKDIFIGMGFEILEGPEVELADYNFTKLNTDEGHPAREWSDTFYLTEDSSILLRTQTSPMQIRAMEEKPLPIRMLAPGRVYRKDEVDATHSPMFHQIEGMVIDKGVTMADLKGTLDAVMKKLYGEDTVTRFRPHHFPFTEPSCEMDVQCHKCGGKGCPTCKGEGWIEILGAGMVHPKVLERGGIDPEVYSGFAFGLGVERLAMFRFNVDDMRLFYENDARFLKQF
jgi:phenylalanyl-tRNA synthetase alpha chain